MAGLNKKGHSADRATASPGEARTYFTQLPQPPEGAHGATNQQRSSELHGRDHAGAHQLPRVDRRRVGDPVLPPEGLHARLHHRARLHGRSEARVREAQLQDHRVERRSGLRPPEVVEGHRGDAGPRCHLPDDRRSGSQRGEGLRHAARGGRGVVPGPDGGRQRHGAVGLRDRARQEGEGDAHLPDEHRPQLRRGAPAARLLPAHGQAQGGDAGELEAGAGRDHRARRL